MQIKHYKLNPGSGWKRSGTILVEREGMDKRRKKLKPMRKGKSKKRAKDEEVNGQGGKRGKGGAPAPRGAGATEFYN